MTGPKYELVITGEIEVTHPQVRATTKDKRAGDRRLQKEKMRAAKLAAKEGKRDDGGTARS